MEQTWITVEAKSKIWEIPWRELWRYRSMIRMLVRRNYQVQSKQSVLGVFWPVLSTVVSTGLFSFVFGVMGRFQSDNMPYFLFFMLGNTLWSVFASCFRDNTRIFADNSYLFGKIYFPRLTVPAANTLTDLLYFLIRFCVCAAAWGVCCFQGNVGFGGWRILLLWLPVLEMSLLGTAAGMLISSLSVKYRDLSHAAGLGLQVLLYASPVVYPLSQLPEAVGRLVLLNPVTAPVEVFRYCLTGCGTVHTGSLIYSAVLTVSVLLAALLLFHRTEKTFIDIV